MTAVDEVTRVVLAPNPSPMTLDGTNTYLLSAPGAGTTVVVDPGPRVEQHRKAVEAAAAASGARISDVVVTHHHADHAEAAAWAVLWQARLHAFNPALVPGSTPLPDGAAVAAAGLRLEAVHTPGHASDHVCLRVLETGAVLSGDHVLGRGTTVVAWPDGDMRAYLGSLRRLAAVGPTALYPGHGPVLSDPRAKIDEYLSHRLEREEQIVAVLRQGPAAPPEIVARVYADVDVALHAAAERSVRAHLDKLVADGRVLRSVDPTRSPVEEYRVRPSSR